MSCPFPPALAGYQSSTCPGTYVVRPRRRPRSRRTGGRPARTRACRLVVELRVIFLQQNRHRLRLLARLAGRDVVFRHHAGVVPTRHPRRRRVEHEQTSVLPEVRVKREAQQATLVVRRHQRRDQIAHVEKRLVLQLAVLRHDPDDADLIDDEQPPAAVGRRHEGDRAGQTLGDQIEPDAGAAAGLRRFLPAALALARSFIVVVVAVAGRGRKDPHQPETDDLSHARIPTSRPLCCQQPGSWPCARQRGRAPRRGRIGRAARSAFSAIARLRRSVVGGVVQAGANDRDVERTGDDRPSRASRTASRIGGHPSRANDPAAARLRVTSWWSSMRSNGGRGWFDRRQVGEQPGPRDGAVGERGRGPLARGRHVVPRSRFEARKVSAREKCRTRSSSIATLRERQIAPDRLVVARQAQCRVADVHRHKGGTRSPPRDQDTS